MFQTTKQLRAKNERLMTEIGRLKTEIAYLKTKVKVSAYIKEAALPKCEGVACYACRYCVTRTFYDPYNGESERVIGCGKGILCEAFTERPKTAKMQEQTRENLREQLQSEHGCQAETV